MVVVKMMALVVSWSWWRNCEVVVVVVVEMKRVCDGG